MLSAASGKITLGMMEFSSLSNLDRVLLTKSQSPHAVSRWHHVWHHQTIRRLSPFYFHVLLGCNGNGMLLASVPPTLFLDFSEALERDLVRRKKVRMEQHPEKSKRIHQETMGGDIVFVLFYVLFSRRKSRYPFRTPITRRIACVLCLVNPEKPRGCLWTIDSSRRHDLVEQSTIDRKEQSMEHVLRCLRIAIAHA